MMKQKTPEFWYPQGEKKPSLFARVLSVPEWMYKQAFKAHQASKKAQKVRVPVLCVGNLVAGGVGKTPSAIAFLALLKKQKIAQNPCFLLRGYGGGERGPIVVDPDKHTAWDVGDESLILAKQALTIVSADRVLGAELAIENGADYIVMDDGLQNPGIHKDIKIVVINGEMGFGNERVMPAGPLREPLESGLKKADAFMLIGEDKTGALAKLPQGARVLNAHLETAKGDVPDQSKSYVAFAGLGYPEKFFRYLKHDLGLNIVEEVRYSDHYPYEHDDLHDLQEKAQMHGAELVTTQKDYLRLPANKDKTIHALPVSLVLENTKAAIALLQAEQEA